MAEDEVKYFEPIDLPVDYPEVHAANVAFEKAKEYEPRYYWWRRQRFGIGLSTVIVGPAFIWSIVALFGWVSGYTLVAIVVISCLFLVLALTPEPENQIMVNGTEIPAHRILNDPRRWYLEAIITLIEAWNTIVPRLNALVDAINQEQEGSEAKRLQILCLIKSIREMQKKVNKYADSGNEMFSDLSIGVPNWYHYWWDGSLNTNDLWRCIAGIKGCQAKCDKHIRRIASEMQSGLAREKVAERGKKPVRSVKKQRN